MYPAKNKFDATIKVGHKKSNDWEVDLTSDADISAIKNKLWRVRV